MRNAWMHFDMSRSAGRHFYVVIMRMFGELRELRSNEAIRISLLVFDLGANQT